MNEIRINIEKIRASIKQPDYKTFKHLLSLTTATRKMLVVNRKLGESAIITEHNGLLAILEFCYIMNESTRYIVVENFNLGDDTVKLMCENCYNEVVINCNNIIELNGGCNNCTKSVIKREIIPELLSGMYNLIRTYNLEQIVKIVSSYTGIDDSYQVIYNINDEEHSADIKEMPEILTKEFIKLRNKVHSSKCAKIGETFIENKKIANTM